MNTRKTSFCWANGPSRYHFVSAILVAFLVLPAVGRADKSPYDWAFIRLDYARKEKVQRLQNICDRIHTLAGQASQDEFVVSTFDINRQYSDPQLRGSISDAVAAKVLKLRERFTDYYIEKYWSFYDLLFVNMQGDVFHTMRKESDLGHNLLQGDRSQTPLGRCLSKRPTSEAFVDFHDYGPSSEPAAFFVEPIRKDGVQIGWIVLQCAINKFNTLLAWTEDLGQTGETFLVNHEGFMLTESNFEGASTILKKRLDDRNIQAKFTEKHGHRTVTDYRGCTALSSFEVVEFLGTRWLVVAKIDKDEVATQHYSQHRRYYDDKLLAYLKETPPAPLRNAQLPTAQKTLRIDMDEFLKADNNQRLHTFGVSTCTGLLVTYPGRFAYLAHISPKDKAYGGNDTNLLGQLVKKFEIFDIYRSERLRIVFVVVATHLDSTLQIVGKLIEEGFLLSQIKVMYNPKAQSAEISYDYPQDNLAVGWRIEGTSNNNRFHVMKDALNVGTIIQNIMLTEGETATSKPEPGKADSKR